MEIESKNIRITNRDFLIYNDEELLEESNVQKMHIAKSDKQVKYII